MAAPSPARLLALAAALAAAATLALAAQDRGGSGSTGTSDDSMFGAETIVQTKPAAGDAAPQDEFLKYDQVKIGGSIAGSLGWTATWKDPWKTTPDPVDPDSTVLKPSLQGRVKIAAKPSTDFGVNMEFREAWPFFSTTKVLTSATTSAAIEQLNLSVWSLYSKFSWKDSLFFSFGKQPLAWGVSKSYFQPANDIFALSAVDFADTAAEREGPIVFKAQYPVPLTMSNVYFYAGVPDAASLGMRDLRLAAKAEASLGNTELAVGGFYSYDDHPRVLLMGTTGNGDFNFFGEAVAKWGSERYFLSAGLPFPSGAQKADQLWFSGTVGGFYTNSDQNIAVSASYYYNGEGQSGVSAKEAYAYYSMHQSEIDRMKFGTHYAALSFSKSKLLVDELSFMVYAVGDLSDRSCMVAPAFTWQFFDYASMKLGATLTFGPDGSEYTMMGGGKPSAAVNISFDLGSGAF